MQTIFLVLLCLNTLGYIDNRWCSAGDGLKCCNGYLLNTATGNCEKCPTGYFGDCSKRCIPPTFGEGCQSLCNCADGFYCHFINGCSQHEGNERVYQSSTGYVSYRFSAFSTPPSVTTEIVTSLHPTFTREISEGVSKVSVTFGNNLNKDNDIFKNNNFFFVIIVLIGIFVLFFAFFVIAYIYLKCFRKLSNSRKVMETDLQAQYKSLDFESMVSDATVHQVNLEQRGRLVSESAYLSPVFVRNESYIEPQCEHENETRRCLTVGQQITNKENNVTASPEDQIENVYIEITDDEELEPKT